MMNYEDNNKLQFEVFDSFISQESLFPLDDIEEEMFQRSRYSAFVPYNPERHYPTLNPVFQQSTSSFYLKNYDSPPTINQERHEKLEYNLIRMDGYLPEAGMMKGEMKMTKKESYSSSSFEEGSEFSLETSQNRSTSASNQGSPLLSENLPK
mmetsp:Transcript_6648/g.4988  ORF Transcript_6648/g.4988 Transcript_6648/m.4988 type:complete len:152 (+) Transcript_6648:28-483(+)